jgi:hypothetical protein
MSRNDKAPIASDYALDSPNSEGRLAFGKHKGRPLAEVPTDYLRWALDGCDLLSAPERRAITTELASRGSEVKSDLKSNRQGFISVSLPHGNQIEIRVRRKLSKDELGEYRRIVKFAERFITEEE